LARACVEDGDFPVSEGSGCGDRGPSRQELRELMEDPDNHSITQAWDTQPDYVFLAMVCVEDRDFQSCDEQVSTRQQISEGDDEDQDLWSQSSDTPLLTAALDHEKACGRYLYNTYYK